MEITPHPFTNLGANPRQEDSRDFKLTTPTGSAAPYPATYMQANAWAAPIYYQGQQPACGAHAGAWLNVLLNSYSGNTPSYTPRFTWIDIKQHDGLAIDDGTDMRSIFQSLQTTGTDDFDPLGNDVTLDEQTYASPSAVTPAMLADAKPNVVSHYGFADGAAFETLKQLIYQNRGVVLMIQVGDEFWTDVNGVSSWAETAILPLRPPKTVIDGHFIVAHSYDENYIYFANSWSTSWGRQGHGYFGPNYMPYVLETGTAASVAPWVTANLTQQVSLYTQVVNLLKQLLSLKK